MASTIRILSDHLANQIAAGEVVQRPESVVKELVENSIDAGARNITVVVKNAGKQLLHIVDDGGGMSKEDLLLAPVRHATSKIASEQDLHSIRTLGFRGEALSSITAVADVEIRSRQAGDDTGWSLMVRPGAEAEIRPVAGDVGTQIFVRNLFYNVPARRKFLKSDLTEFRHISETMQRLALSRPDLRFTFHDGDVLVFDVRPSDLRERIAMIMSLDATHGLLAVDGEEGGITVRGYVGMPSLSRQSRSGQFMFMNGRGIVSRSLAHAVASAYEHLLDPGQHPVFVLHLTLDPQRVDVNVHPQKHEVKFDDERLVYLLVQQSVATALQKANVVPSFIGDAGLANAPLQSLPRSPQGAPFILNRLTGELQPAPSQGASWSFGGGSGGGYQHAPQTERPFTEAVQRGYQELFAGAAPSDSPVSTILSAPGGYLVTTSAEGIVVIDQQTAHERVLYERALRQTTPAEAAGQALLFSVRMRLSPSHGALLREYHDEFAALGFRLDVEADGSVDIHAVPSDVRPGNEEDTLTHILATLEDAGRLPPERRKEGLAGAFARRQAVRRSDRLQAAEQQALVRDLFNCTVPHTSPRGEPTYVVITFDELVQRFR